MMAGGFALTRWLDLQEQAQIPQHTSEDCAAPRPWSRYVLHPHLLHPRLSEMQGTDRVDTKLDTNSALEQGRPTVSRVPSAGV